MPESSVDRVLDLLDAGLQSSEETGYGTDRRPDACARCQRTEPAEGGDLCGGCRAFLLGDSPADPTQPPPQRHGASASNVRVMPLDADGNPAGPSIPVNGAQIPVTFTLYPDDAAEVSFEPVRPVTAEGRRLLRGFWEWTPPEPPAPFRILLHVPEPSGQRWAPIRSGGLGRLCSTVDTYRPPAAEDGQLVERSPAVVVEESQVVVAMCGLCGCPVEQVTYSEPEPEPGIMLGDPAFVAVPLRSLRVEPCGHRWGEDVAVPAFEVWARPITDLPAVAGWAARWLHRFESAAANPGVEPALGVVDRFDPDCVLVAEGPAPPNPRGAWQAEAIAHLVAETCAAQAVAAEVQMVADATGCDLSDAATIRAGELAAAGQNVDSAVLDRVTARAEWAAAGP